MNNSLAGRINYLLKAHSLDRERFFMKFEITPKKFNSWFDTNNYPSVAVMIDLADYFNVTLDYLAGRSSEGDMSELDRQILKVYHQLPLLQSHINTLLGFKPHFSS